MTTPPNPPQRPPDPPPAPQQPYPPAPNQAAAGPPPDGLPSPWVGGGPPPSPWPHSGAPLPPSHPQAPPQSKKPIVLGALIGLAGVILSALAGVLGDQTFRDAGISGGLVVSPLVLVPLVGFVMIFPERTRRWGAGILLGVALSLMVGFAACVAVFFTYLSASGQ